METINTIPDLNNIESLAVASAPAMLSISTVAPDSVSSPFLLIRKDQRDSKLHKVAECDRHRSILVHESALLVPASSTSSKFLSLLQATILDLAKARFEAFLKDQPLAKEVPAALFTIDSVLAFWAEEKASQRIDGASISSWLLASATFASLTPKSQEVWKKELPKFAAPGYKMAFSKANAAAIIARIADADIEQSNAVCEFIMQRANNIISAADEERDF